MKISTVLTIKGCLAFFFNINDETFNVCNKICACDLITNTPLHCLSTRKACDSIIKYNKLSLKLFDKVSSYKKQHMIHIFLNLFGFVLDQTN